MVLDRDGPLMVAANAGSGKTTVLVERFARAVRDRKLDISSILVITYTDRAAGELRTRIRARLLELYAADHEWGGRGPIALAPAAAERSHILHVVGQVPKQSPRVRQLRLLLRDLAAHLIQSCFVHRARRQESQWRR